MSTRLTILTHGQPMMSDQLSSRNGHVKLVGIGQEDDESCTQLSRAPRIGSMPMLRTQIGPSMPTPVSPISYMSQYWPQAPITVERSQVYTRDMIKPPTISQKEQQLRYLPTPPASPSTPRAPPSMFTLPNETLDRVFSFLPLTMLPTLMRANRLCHALAERQLYFKVQHIQLYEGPENEGNTSWQCLRTLASRHSAATSVRHFAVRGLPWMDSSAASILLRALGNMTKLCSLHLELGAPFEKALVRDKLAMTALTSLCALNVSDAQAALALCSTISGIRRLTTPSALPLAALRIAPDSPLDVSAVHELLQALTWGQTGDLQVLQMALICESEDELPEILGKLAQSLPCLETLGLHVKINNEEKMCEIDVTQEEDRVSRLLQRMSDALARFPSLRKISLATVPFPAPTWVQLAQGDIENLVKGCQRLEVLELQWSVWHAEAITGGQSWIPVPAPPGHSYIRSSWIYEHASVL
ncbi:hypothetical protein M408DRAFT_327667 [Serendipita vermifera MAFF 305830]|uniref:F-box domain-containing protein n=1 Tax=Serendipita vermifera MAFF 305830 TaxID=933852 RepID=A0A0C3BIX1_SERVB|nr:hypothetical protein M408DRAFT_327667 [Serendipita vermifera MAFF 305830]